MSEGKAQQESDIEPVGAADEVEPVTDARVVVEGTDPESAETAKASEPAIVAENTAPAPKKRTAKIASDKKATKTETVDVGAGASTYAIIETGGKQYRVRVGDQLAVERLPVETGGDLTMGRVLLVSEQGTVKVGTPVVEGAAVTARVDDHYRGEKIVVFKYKPKKRYRRRMGHRQSLTRLTITGISG